MDWEYDYQKQAKYIFGYSFIHSLSKVYQELGIFACCEFNIDFRESKHIDINT